MQGDQNEKNFSNVFLFQFMSISTSTSISLSTYIRKINQIHWEYTGKVHYINQSKNNSNTKRIFSSFEF